MPTTSEAIEKAIKGGQISKGQIQFCINSLACYSQGYIVSGGDNKSVCNRARLTYNHPVTNVESIFPSGTEEIPPVCQDCPVFAPALIALTKRLPQ